MGEENDAPSRSKFFGPLQKEPWKSVQKKKSNNNLSGAENVPDGGGVQNPFLGGVSFMRFSSPPLFPHTHTHTHPGVR